VRYCCAAVACLVVLLAGCGGGGGPRSVVRRYEKAIVSRDGKSLCATFAPKLRQVLAEQADTGGRRFDCAAFFHALIGFPHENVERQFIAGKLLSVGGASRVERRGVAYVRVPARVRIEYAYTGYSTRTGQRDSATVEDVVWLAKGPDGHWGVVKPSLALNAASIPDVLYDRFNVVRVNAAPPDPDYSMTRAERTRSEAADYRASFRRDVGHAPLACSGESASVADPAADAVTYPTGSALHPAPAPAANDIVRVVVQVDGGRMCVAVTFRRKPAGKLWIGLDPSSRHVFLPEYSVELDPSGRVRGGSPAASYRYFRGGNRLDRAAVPEISLYGHVVAFAADAGESRRFPPDLTWKISAGGPSGSDMVPDARPSESAVVRQRDGRIVKRRRAS